MKKYIIAILLCSKLAFSADQQTQPTADNQNQTSLENRKELQYQATVSILGAEYSGYHHSLAIAVGYFIDDKNLINLRYTFENSPGLASNTSTNDYPETLRAITIGDRHFFGNSFNILGSLYWKDHSKFDRSNGHTYFFKDYGLGIRVGNEWQWKNFTMGCDWFGLNRTLIKVYNTFPSTSFGLDQERTIAFLNLYLGYSF